MVVRGSLHEVVTAELDLRSEEGRVQYGGAGGKCPWER